MQHHTKFVMPIALLLFAACTDRYPASDIPIINFEEAEERVFDLKEILEDLKLVQLETIEQGFINQASFAVGEKFIIAVSRNNVLQFTAEGAFVRVLAQRGGGPQEFQDVRAFSMDGKEQKLYIDHIGRKTSIMVFDLNSGNFDGTIQKPLEALNLESGFSIDRMTVVNDSIYCIPERNYAGQSGLYIQRTSGEFLASFPRDDQVITANAYFSASPFLSIESETNNIRYMSRDRDTLFAISATAKEAYVAITYEDKLTYKPNFTEITGNLINMLGEGPSGILFEKTMVTVKQMRNSISASITSGGLYFTDKTGFVPVKISRLMMDEVEFSSKIRWGHNNGTMSLAVPAVLFKDILQSAIENSSGNPEALERWNSLDEQISEYDNPILVVGKMK